MPRQMKGEENNEKLFVDSTQSVSFIRSSEFIYAMSGAAISRGS